MKISRTLLFASFTTLIVIGVYVFDYLAIQKNNEVQTALILNQQPAQINYIQIIKSDQKIAMQKGKAGWSILEPIQDLGDNKNIEEFLNNIAEERQISVVKMSNVGFEALELQDYGLDKPAVTFSFKNNMGYTQKITVGSVKNFEGNSYILINSENRIILASSFWASNSENDLIHYREKKLYRGNIGNIIKLKIKSLRDEFELNFFDGKWHSADLKILLDQNKVHEVLKKISETKIVQYVYEGEPSTSLIKEKHLDTAPVYLELYSKNSSWSIKLNIKANENSLYALTERPTFIVKVDIPAWETIGNLNLDELRDRAFALTFNLSEVEKIYYKNNNQELDVLNKSGKWEINSTTPSATKLNDAQIKKMIMSVHKFKISEFLDSKTSQNKFEGKNMLIFKSATEKLVLQLNWGPTFKIKKAEGEIDYYYVRTNLSDLTFAIEKKIIDSLKFENSIDAKNSEVLIE